jgi:F0F1-type ATP synthase assembly protein I
VTAKAPGAKKRPGVFGVPLASEYGPYLTLGLQLALSVVVFFFLGRWLDGLWGTAPWLTVAGLVIGVAGGFIKFITTALALGRKADEDARSRGAGGDGHED